MIGLKRPYPSVVDGREYSYGGNQMRSDSAVIRRCGCGPVAALDLCRYLESPGRPEPLALEDYNRELRRICQRYFWLLPPFGIDGLRFVAGLNLMFLEKRLPYRALWAASGAKLWARAEEMLRQDIPVILSVGPNFPAVWEKHSLCFYTRQPNGSFAPALSIKSHFVTVTGIEGDWVRLSSWGRQYYLSRREYAAYVSQHSASLFTNLVLITRR